MIGKKRFGLAALAIALTVSCGKKNDDHKDEPVVENAPVTDPLPGGPKKPDPVQVKLGELTCFDHGGYITDCTMEDKTLGEKQASVSKFTLEYSFACKGSQMAIVAQFGDLAVPLKQEADQKMELIGNGPFVLKDSDPKWSKSADLQPGCSLDVTSFSVVAI